MHRRSLFFAFPLVLAAAYAHSQVAAQTNNGMILPPTSDASAPDIGKTMYSMGTGFFVSYDGYVVTNEHVVKGCTKAIVRGTVPSTEANVLQVDAANDLALLKTDLVPMDIAKLSTSNIALKENDRVMVMGYPGENSMTGIYKVVESKVISGKGPRGEEGWVQFKSSADHGNSGGPLLDATGNVIGVVQGHVILQRMNAQLGKAETVGESDVAISLPVLMPFLDRYRVPYQRNPNNTNFMASTIENNAKRYIVNVVCAQK